MLQQGVLAPPTDGPCAKQGRQRLWLRASELHLEGGRGRQAGAGAWRAWHGHGRHARVRRSVVRFERMPMAARCMARDLQQRGGLVARVRAADSLGVGKRRHGSGGSSVMWVLLVLCALAAVGAGMLFRRRVWSPNGKVRVPLIQHVLITGASQGLGLALAKLLAAQGAHLVLCSRSQSKLDRALAEVESARVNKAQVFRVVAADVSTFAGASAALAQCGAVPDTVFCCAGGAQPGFFVEQTEADFEAAVRTDYFTALATAQVGTVR